MYRFLILNFQAAVVWLKKGECLNSLGRLEEAAVAYARVVTLAPNHLDARLLLASLHQQLGRPNKALEVLSGKQEQLIPLKAGFHLRRSRSRMCIVKHRAIRYRESQSDVERSEIPISPLIPSLMINEIRQSRKQKRKNKPITMLDSRPCDSLVRFLFGQLTVSAMYNKLRSCGKKAKRINR